MKTKNTSLKNPSIVIIGSGNLASQLITQLIKYKLNLIQVISRSNKKELDTIYNGNIKIENNISSMATNANVYFIITNDDSISEIVQNWSFKLHPSQLIVHCSGSISSKILSSITNNFGVFWPIQSFSKKHPLLWKDIPICITSSNKFSSEVIWTIATTLSSNVPIVNDTDRTKLHMIAVIVNNFTNHLYDLSDQYLQSNNLPFKLFLPIIKETVNNLVDKSPRHLQTGPAIRKDLITIEKHHQLLNQDKNLLKIYEAITHSIQDNKL